MKKTRRLFRIPVHHRALLRIPAAGLVNFGFGVLPRRIQQDDVGRVLWARHAVLKRGAQRDQMPAVGAVRRVAHMADVAVEMMGGPEGQLPDFVAEL